MRDPVELVLSMLEEERRTWLRALAPDDAADLIQDAPEEQRPSLLATLDPWPRAEVSALFRAMALGEVRLRHWWRVLRREVTSGAALGAVLCGMGVTRILAWQGISRACGEHFARVALTVGASLIGVVLFGTIAGGMLPFVLRACRLDPASASAPAVATLVDVSGLIIYFSFAKVIMLRGLP